MGIGRDELKAAIEDRARENEAKHRPSRPGTEALVEALLEEVAEMRADAPLARDRVLSLEEAAEQTPWSKSTLYRHAADPKSPFHKVGGRWVTTQADLIEWVRDGPKPQTRRPYEDPMPMPSSKSGRQNFRRLFEQKVREKEEGSG